MLLGAGETNVGHAGWAVRRAQAATNIVEVGIALRVVQSSPLLRAVEFFAYTGASAVGVGLVTVGSLVLEVVGARLPADRALANEAWLALIVAEVCLSVLVGSARRNWQARGSAGGLLPAGELAMSVVTLPVLILVVSVIRVVVLIYHVVDGVVHLPVPVAVVEHLTVAVKDLLLARIVVLVSMGLSDSVSIVASVTVHMVGDVSVVLEITIPVINALMRLQVLVEVAITLMYGVSKALIVTSLVGSQKSVDQLVLGFINLMITRQDVMLPHVVIEVVVTFMSLRVIVIVVLIQAVRDAVGAIIVVAFVAMALIAVVIVAMFLLVLPLVRSHIGVLSKLS